MIRRLAEKAWTASRKESRIARTVVLKLKSPLTAIEPEEAGVDLKHASKSFRSVDREIWRLWS
jgi:prolyl-tRNA editing enzyme YbaK/EbsC (Cys-tRNA(Pro) deacylase)